MVVSPTGYSIRGPSLGFSSYGYPSLSFPVYSDYANEVFHAVQQVLDHGI